MADDRHPGRPAALLLDFGSVVTRSVFEIADVAERRLGLLPGALYWRGALDPAHDALWRDMQADLITERAYWEIRAAEIGACLGKAWTPLDFFRAMRGGDLNEDVRPEMVALVGDAKAAGLKVGILSNELELFAGREAMEGLDVLRLMDFVIDGTHTGILKPDPRAYAMAAEKFSEPPGTVMFVDDQARNIRGAREAGMRTHHFRIEDPGFSVREIREALEMKG